MTGFASGNGAMGPYSWGWEIRGVNGKGLDLRFRVPDWIEGLEAGLRRDLTAVCARGNITVSLRMTRGENGGSVQINAPQLTSILIALSEIEAQAMDAGVSLAPSKASDIVALRGILEQSTESEDNGPLCKLLFAEFEQLAAAFNEMRETEGRALVQVLMAQLDEIETLMQQAISQADTRKSDMATALRRNLQRVLDNSNGVDPQRLEQELAIIAVKADVTEEIDRLAAHIKAARDLIAKGGAVGRKLDFLMQEFNREANTLCSKSQNTELTSIGLALKAVIDQMREQVQNVE
ncbi:MAG: YicC/YloC family endoribonuclease [Sulfitobacter sp.]